MKNHETTTEVPRCTGSALNDLLANNNIMLDLETMGNNSHSAIIAIGAVRFQETITDEFYRIVDLKSSLDVGLRVDADTIMWWMKRSDGAREQFNRDKVALSVALVDFIAWIGVEPVVWGNGATFDNVILSNAYSLCGINRPWGYRADRCYRTVKNMYPNIEAKRTGIYHKAVDDAINQANHLIRILEG